MSTTTVGSCSICGGRVSVPLVWWGVVPPIPQCDSCGAVEASPHGPVIQMQPRAPTFTTTGTGMRPFQHPDGTWELK